MVDKISGSGSSNVAGSQRDDNAAAARAEAARRAAEEARRAAEAARRREEAARLAAEAARLAAEKARAAAEKLARAAKSVPTGERRELKAEIDKANAKVKELAAKADEAKLKLDQLTAKAGKADEKATSAMKQANRTAKLAGAAEPYDLSAQVKAAETPVRRRDELNKLLGTDTALTPTASNLSAEAAYAKLANLPGTGGILDALHIHDGAALQGLATRLAREAQGGVVRADDTRLAKLAGTVDPKVLSTVIQTAGSTLSGADQALVTNPAFADALATGKTVAQAAAATGAAPTADPKALAKLGLTPEDFAGAADAAKPALIKAAEAAVAGKPAEALAALGEAAKLGAPALAEKALPKLAEKLPDGAIKQILTNPDFVHALVNGAPDTIAKLAAGDLAGAADELKNNPAIQKFFQDKLGVDLSKVADPSVILEHGTKALDHLEKGEYASAVRDLQQMTKALDPQAFGPAFQKLGEAICAKLPADARAKVQDLFGKLGAALQGDPAKGAALLKALETNRSLPDIVEAFAKGDTAGALKLLAEDHPLLEAAGDAVASMKVVQDSLAKLGIDITKIKDPGKAITSAIDLAQHVEAGDWAASVKDMQALAKNVDPATFSGMFEKIGQAISDKLPAADRAKVQDFFAKVGDALTGDPKKGAALLKALENSKSLPTVIDSLAKGDTQAAFNALAEDPKLLDAAGDAFASMNIVKDACAKIGIDLSKVKDPGKALASAVALAEHIEQGNWAEATKDVQALAKYVDPAAFKGVFDKIGQAIGDKLPAADRAKVQDFFAKVGDALAGDPKKGAALLKALQTSESLPAIVDALAKGDTKAAFKALAGDEKLLDAAGDALATMNIVKDSLAKLGIDLSKVEDPGKALASAVGLAEHLEEGNFGAATKDLQALAQEVDPATFQGLFDKVGKAVSDKLPAAQRAKVQDFFNQIGKALAGDPAKGKALLDALVKSEALPTVVDALAKGDTAGALKALAGDTTLVDAAGDAVASMKIVQDTLTKLGIDLSKVKDPGAVLNTAIALGQHLEAGDFGAATKDLQALAQEVDPATFQGLFDKVGKAVSDKLPAAQRAKVQDFFNQIGKALAGDPAKGKALLDALVKSEALPTVVDALAKGDTAGALKALAGDTTLVDAAGDAVASMKIVQDTLAKLGIDLSKVKDPGAVLNTAIALGQHLEAGDFGAATKDLQSLAQNVDPAAFQGMFDKLGAAIGDKVPPEVKAKVQDFFAQIGKTLAGDPTRGKALLDALANSQSLPTVVADLAKGDLAGALKSLAGDTALLNAAGDAVGSMKIVQDAFAKLGIDASKLPNLGEVAPKLLALADSLEAGKFGDATKQLIALGGTLDPAAFQGLWDKVSAKLPAPVKDFLTKAAANGDVQNLLKTFANSPSLPKMVDQLAAGDVGGALTTLGDDKALMAAAGQALADIPQVTQFLQDKLGLTADQVKSLGAAAMPQLAQAIESAAKGDVPGALQHLLDAAKDVPPDVAKAIVDKVLADLKPQIDKLPPAAQTALRAIASSAEILVKNANDPNLRAGIAKIAAGDLAGGLKDIARSTALMTDVGAALAKSPEVQAFLQQKLGLNADQVAELGAALPDLMQAVAANTPEEALASLKAAAEKSPKVLALIGEKVWDMLPAKVRSGLSAMGLDQTNMKELGTALPKVLDAADKIGKGDWQGALNDLGQALESAPNTVAKAVATIAGKIPDDPKFHLLKAALTDKDLVALLVSDKSLHAGFQQMLSGDFAGGLKAIAGNGPVMTEIGKVLLSDPKASELLAKVGITNPEDLAQLGNALGHALELAADLQAGKYENALEAFGQMMSDVPVGMRAKMGEAIAKALHLPPGLADLIVEGGVALTDPAIRAQLGRAVSSLQKSPPDAGAFVDSLAEVGELMATKYPDAAVGFLDLMGKLPGSVGRFFGSHELNDMLVKSGSVKDAFQAMQLLAQGKIPEALQKLGGAIGDLIGQEPHYSVGIDVLFVHAHQDLPFGEKGLKAMTLLFGQFIEALPTKIKEKILTETAKLAAKAGGSLIPGGSLLGLIGDGPDLYGALTHDPKDWLDVALKATKCGLDIAGVIPGAGAITGPLGTVVGIVDFVHGAADLIGDINEFKNEFAFGAAA